MKEFSITSTVFEMALFFHTEDRALYDQTLKLCEDLNNKSEGEDFGLVLIHPDHHKCYFYGGYFDHKKIIKFLQDKEKAHIRPFDEISLEMHQFYNLPIVVLFRDYND